MIDGKFISILFKLVAKSLHTLLTKNKLSVLEEPYKFCIIDGVQQQVGNFKLVDLSVSKNKMSTYIGQLPFKFYPEISRTEPDEPSENVFK